MVRELQTQRLTGRNDLVKVNKQNNKQTQGQVDEAQRGRGVKDMMRLEVWVSPTPYGAQQGICAMLSYCDKS